MLPSQFLNLDPQEKAFVIAAIDMKIDAEKKQAAEIKRKSKKH